MKQTINFYQFERAFTDSGRFLNFGYEGLRVLFDYIVEMEEYNDEETELDVIALCCDYSHEKVADIADNYGIDIVNMEEDEARETVREYLERRTTVCGETEDGFVYCSSF